MIKFYLLKQFLALSFFLDIGLNLFIKNFLKEMLFDKTNFMYENWDAKHVSDFRKTILKKCAYIIALANHFRRQFLVPKAHI
jgi:hypothetical protein